MAFNSTENALFLFAFLMMVGTYIITFLITDTIVTEFNAQVIKAGFTIPAYATNFYTTARGIVIVGLRMFIWIMIAMAIFTSFIDPQNIVSYIGSVMISFIVSVVVIIFASILWNMLIVAYSQTFAIQPFMNDLLFFPQYFVEIIVANLFAGLVSFVWSPKRNSNIAYMGY